MESKINGLRLAPGRRAIVAGLPRSAGMITGYETGNPSFRRKPESTPTGCRWRSRACLPRAGLEQAAEEVERRREQAAGESGKAWPR